MKRYRVQKSLDGGAAWEDLAVAFPAGGAGAAELSFEDRTIDPSDPDPQYRVLPE
ncbi:MAG: hypothetical protein R3F11_30580 [Verrucomicrobiales bacterium]